MKKLLFYFISFVLLAGCQSNGVPADTTGEWKIKSFIDNKGRDRTSKYSAFTFDFGSNGALKVIQGSTQFNGMYSEVMDSGKQKFFIAINTTNEDLSDLNEDWRLVSKSTTSIKLNNPNSGDGFKALEFVK